MITGSKENPCHSCRAGYHAECMEIWHYEDVECCCGGEVSFDQAGNVRTEDTPADVIDGREIDSGYLDSNSYSGTKSLSDISDPLSTGRKRASQVAPIEPGYSCEWAGLKRAGGGLVPIVGCIGRPASDRHHGPDKNTMNNALGTNLHRICDHCHNTWHALNDPGYGPRPPHTQPFIPQGELGVDWFSHDSVTKASPEEILEAEAKRLRSGT